LEHCNRRLRNVFRNSKCS